jgi:hypothetical protein
VFWAERQTFLRFLFERPERFGFPPKNASKIPSKPTLSLQPAEYLLVG